MSLADDLRTQMSRLKPTAENIRAVHTNIRKMTNKFDVVGPDMRNVDDFIIDHPEFPVPVRLYIPVTAATHFGPTLVFVHGGGFVTCSLESHEGMVKRIADSSGMRVLSVDYRLAPQYPFPAAPNDCEHVLKWVLSGEGKDEHGIDPDHIAVGGDSAGGNISAYLAQKYRVDLNAQLLLYPLMQLAEIKPQKPGLQDALQLGVVVLKYINSAYVQDSDVMDTRLSPMFERDLKGLPPAYMLTCGLDPLRFEGNIYADNLENSGVSVTRRHEKAMPHGFLNFSRAFAPGKTVPVEVGQFLRTHMNPR